MTTKYTLRYSLWALSNGRSAEEQILVDKSKISKMMDFMLWIDNHWTLFYKHLGLESSPLNTPVVKDKHVKFDEWLQDKITKEMIYSQFLR